MSLPTLNTLLPTEATTLIDRLIETSELSSQSEGLYAESTSLGSP